MTKQEEKNFCETLAMLDGLKASKQLRLDPRKDAIAKEYERLIGKLRKAREDLQVLKQEIIDNI